MLTFGWGEILLVFFIFTIVIGPKELPNLIRQLSGITRSIKKLSREFRSSIDEIANHEDLNDIKSSFDEIKNIKKDLNINNKFKSTILSSKESAKIIQNKDKDVNNLNNK